MTISVPKISVPKTLPVIIGRPTRPPTPRRPQPLPRVPRPLPPLPIHPPLRTITPLLPFAPPPLLHKRSKTLRHLPPLHRLRRARHSHNGPPCWPNTLIPNTPFNLHGSYWTPSPQCQSFTTNNYSRTFVRPLTPYVPSPMVVHKRPPLSVNTMDWVSRAPHGTTLTRLLIFSPLLRFGGCAASPWTLLRPHPLPSTVLTGLLSPSMNTPQASTSILPLPTRPTRSYPPWPRTKNNSPPGKFNRLMLPAAFIACWATPMKNSSAKC